VTLSNSFKKKIVIIIPAKNEYANLVKLLPKLSLFKLNIIVINDGSNDKTKTLRNKVSNLKIINLNKSIGYDNALKYGILEAKRKFKFVITMDSDLEHDPKYLKVFIKNFKKDFDLIIGERDRKNRLVEIIFGYFFKKIFNLNDIFCGFRGIKLEKLSKKYLKIKNIHLPEIIFFTHYKNKKTLNFKIKCKKRVGSSKFGNSFFGNIKLFLQILPIIFKKSIV
jgi:glycosyltransferase involved in cell wall biosynthesis